MLNLLFQSYRKNQLVNRFAKVFSVDVLVKASGFILLPIYLKLMTQEEYGLYNYMLSIIGVFALVLNFGLYIPQIKLYQSYKTKQEKGALQFVIGVLLLAMLAIVLGIVYWFRLDFLLVKILFKTSIEYSAYRMPVLFGILTTISSFMLFNYFLASEKIPVVQRYNLLRLLVGNGLVIVLLLYLTSKSTVLVRLWGMVSVEILLVLCFLPVYLKNLVVHFDFKIASRSLGLASPILISGVLNIFLSFNDKFILEKTASLSILSIYYLAISIANILPMIFTTLQNVWQPIFYKEHDLHESLRKTKKLGGQVILIFLGLSGALFIATVVAMQFHIINAKYKEVLFILPIMLVSQIINALNTLQGNYLVHFEKTFVSPIAAAAFGMTSIGLNLILIPRFTIYGAACVSLLISCLYFISYRLIVAHYFKLNLKVRFDNSLYPAAPLSPGEVS